MCTCTNANGAWLPICFPDWLSLNVELDCGEGGVVGGAEDIGGRHGRARIGQELEGEARLAAFIGHSQVANARFAFVASAPALTVGCCPTGILWRVGTVGPVDPAIIP